MRIFGAELSKVEIQQNKNVKDTKSIFPEETKLLEFGLGLMWRFTDIANESADIHKDKPNIVANQNLFGRNRQLLTNAYYSLLSSNYGSCFILLRTIYENNNLMRLFNKKPKSAFSWFSEDRRIKFPTEIQNQYGKSEKKMFKPDVFPTLKELFGKIANKKVKSDYERMYGEICNYSHPNYFGWQELMGDKNEKELLLDKPEFVLEYAEIAIGLMIFYTQLSFKTFVETFKTNTMIFNDQIEKWIEGYNKYIPVYTK